MFKPLNAMPGRDRNPEPVDNKPSTRQVCLDLLARPGGVTLVEIGAATGGQARMTIKHSSQKESALETLIVRFSDLDLAGLRAAWVETTGTEAPRISRDLMLLALAYHLQEKALGGLSPSIKKQLVADDGTDKKFTPVTLRPGTRLVREWQNQTHVVTVGAEGSFLWQGQSWTSLSRIARLITGTRWSGPAFFGLKRSQRGLNTPDGANP